MPTAKPSKTWPILTEYDADHLLRLAMPIGGIGTGTVSLGGRGNLQDWEIVNRPGKGFCPQPSFFALWAKPAGGEPVTRCLEGPIPEESYEGFKGCLVPNHTLPRFREARFAAAYPLGQVMLSDPDVPLAVRMEAFNPFIPADADDSGLPVAVIRFVLENRTWRNVSAAVCGSLQNFIGTDGRSGDPKGNVNAFREGKKLRGLWMRSRGADPKAEQTGTIALTTLNRGGVTHRTSWAKLTWGNALLDFWDDFSDDGRLDNRPAGGAEAPVGSLAVRTPIPAGRTRTITFLLSWHFPNRMTWFPTDEAGCDCQGPWKSSDAVGNHYATRFRDAWDTAEKVAPRLARLEKDTVAFVESVANSDLPAPVLEAALNNTSTLRTQTTFRTPEGMLFGWEGCCDQHGCCHGTCTHVWNYEQTTAYLFGDLSRSMRDAEFLHATDDEGYMSFRISLPLDRRHDFGAAADGQMGCLMKLHRDWKLSGDDDWLRKLWPRAKKAMQFARIPGGWDADRDGVMEGCQHNTMDVEYFGPNPEMGSWYLGALRACEEMARYLGDEGFADTCREMFEHGSRWLDANLFNGEYYEQEIRPIREPKSIAPHLRLHEGARDPRKPVLQLGSGCLVDQLVGQYFAHLSGLGHLLRPANVRKALRSVMKYNFREHMYGHFNHFRSYALNDEPGVLLATWPRGGRPEEPFPYCNEVWSGLEYTAAVGMLQEGLDRDGLKIIAAARRRYDGRKRSPFDEAECGHHYARAMAAWAAIPAMTGFEYDAPSGHLLFAAAEGIGRTQWFWSNGYAWGTLSQRRRGKTISAELNVLGGRLKLRRFTLRGHGSLHCRKTIPAGRSVRLRIEKKSPDG